MSPNYPPLVQAYGLVPTRRCMSMCVCGIPNCLIYTGSIHRKTFEIPFLSWPISILIFLLAHIPDIWGKIPQFTCTFKLGKQQQQQINIMQIFTLAANAA